jgi:hypothetical protein
MRRTLSGAACLALLATTAVGCARPPSGAYAPGAEELHVERAFLNALQAEDPWQRELWQIEYERRALAYDKRLEIEQRRRQARAESWQQLMTTARELGAAYLEYRLYRASD